jgi:hypothetical protein
MAGMVCRLTPPMMKVISMKKRSMKFYEIPEDKEQGNGNASAYKIEGIFFIRYSFS